MEREVEGGREGRGRDGEIKREAKGGTDRGRRERGEKGREGNMRRRTQRASQMKRFIESLQQQTQHKKQVYKTCVRPPHKLQNLTLQVVSSESTQLLHTA